LDSGTDLPLEVAFVLSWRDGRSYRGGHPRSYIGGMVQDRLQDAGIWSTTTLSDMQSAGTAFLAAVNAISGIALAPVSLGDVEFYTGHALQTPGIFHAYSSCVARPRPGSQRRRGL
jgi:hypothetical protein